MQIWLSVSSQIKFLLNFIALTSRSHRFVQLIVTSKLLAICLGQWVICLLIQRENSHPSPLPIELLNKSSSASMSTPSTAECNPFASIQREMHNQCNINFPAVPPAGPPIASPQTLGAQAPPPISFIDQPHFVTPPPVRTVPEELIDTLLDFSFATPSTAEHRHPTFHDQQTQPAAPTSQACFVPLTPEDLLSLTVDPNAARPSPQN